MSDLKFNFSGLHKKEKEIIEKIGGIVQTEMESRAPKESYAMVGSIKADINGNEVSIGTHGIEYASHVEYFDWTGLDSAKYVKELKPPADADGLVPIPNEVWLALIKRSSFGETIPFARSAAFYSTDNIMIAFKEVFHK